MVKKNMFNKGFDNVKEEAKRQEAVREANKNRVNRFFLSKDGDEADVYFLNEEPVNYRAHTVPQTTQSGKTFYKDFLCTGEKDCDYCVDHGNPSFKSAFLVIDNTPYETKDGKTVPQTLKMYSVGTRVATQLARLSTKYGLVNRTYTIVRNGSGTSTTYTVERGDKVKVSNELVKKLLPEDVKEMFDGTEESVQSIIEEMLMTEDALNKGEVLENDEDDEADDGVIAKDLDEDEDDEEEEKPKSKVSKFKKLTTNKQTSTKPRTSVVKKR